MVLDKFNFIPFKILLMGENLHRRFLKGSIFTQFWSGHLSAGQQEVLKWMERSLGKNLCQGERGGYKLVSLLSSSSSPVREKGCTAEEKKLPLNRRTCSTHNFEPTQKKRIVRYCWPNRRQSKLKGISPAFRSKSHKIVCIALDATKSSNRQAAAK